MIIKCTILRDFGTNYPTDYLFDGWKLSPDFDSDTTINSYSGTRNFRSTPDFSLRDIYILAWKKTSPIYGF